MLELIFTIAIAVLISYFKNATKNEKRQANAAQQQNVWDNVVYQAPKRNVRTTPASTQVQQQNNRFQQAAQANIEKAKQRAEKKSAMQQVNEGRVETRNTTILQRAMANADEDKVDVTLHTMEAEHNHSERVAPATHHHPEDVIPENMLGNIEDLMVKGYDGNLCFERDFVGEAMDMINRFTVPTDVPDFETHDMA